MDLYYLKLLISMIPIQIARRYKQYEHAKTKFFKLDKKLNQYWTDMYEKLLKIKSKGRKIKNLKLYKPIFSDNSLIYESLQAIYKITFKNNHKKLCRVRIAQ